MILRRIHWLLISSCEFLTASELKTRAFRDEEGWLTLFEAMQHHFQGASFEYNRYPSWYMHSNPSLFELLSFSFCLVVDIRLCFYS